MSLERKILFERAELDKDDNVSVLLKKAIVDGDELVSSSLHRVMIPAGHNVDEYMNSVSVALQAEGFPPISNAVLERPKRLRTLSVALPVIEKPRKTR